MTNSQQRTCTAGTQFLWHSVAVSTHLRREDVVGRYCWHGVSRASRIGFKEDGEAGSQT